MDRTKLTPRGWCMAGVSVMAIGVGFLAVQGALIAVGIAGLVILLGTKQLSRRNLAGVDIERLLPPSSFAGDLVRARYHVRLHRTGTATSIRIEDLLGPVIRPVDCDKVGSEGATALTEIQFENRGAVREGDVILRSEFPLGMFEAVRWLSVSSPSVVFPRPIMTKTMLEAGEALDVHALAYAGTPDGAEHFRGVREFRPGDPVARIHWPATARARTPMVREFDPPAPQPTQVSILFHSYSPSGYLLRPRAFEIALSMITGLLLHARGIPASVTFNGQTCNWVPMQIETADELREALAVLARARYRPERTLEKVEGALKAIPQTAEARVFVISDTPVDLWSGLLPATSRPLVCIDTRGSFRKIIRTAEWKGN